jgi:predicted adenylyl cyclase CyaB
VNNKEIELKFIITKEIKSQIINDLEKSCNKIFEEHLIDTYYEPTFKSFEVNGQTMECVRIRENHNKCILGYKKIHRESNPVYCDEFETEIANKHQMENILFAIGFNTQMIIDKTRVSYKLGGFRFDFDSVKNLGELLEVELVDQNATVENIYNFVSKYNLSKKDVTYEGIQSLMKRALMGKC